MTLFLISCSLSGYCVRKFLRYNNHHHWIGETNNKHHIVDDRKARFTRTRPKRTKKIPKDWDTYSFEDVYRHFHCWSHARDNTKPIPSLEQWLFLRKQYNEYVDGSVFFNDPIPPTQGYTLSDDKPPPFYPKLSPGKGRGLFASRDIKKGEIVHDGTNSDVVFPDAKSFRRFLFALPRTMSCDMMEWTWTQQLHEDGPYHICLSINIASLMNTESDEEEANALPKTSTSTVFYATRDIRKGEEILTDYSVYETDWVAVGMDNL